LVKLVGLVKGGWGMSTRLQGRPASPGIALAPAFVIQPRSAVSVTPAATRSREEEHARLDVALEEVEAKLRELADRMIAEIGPHEARIFEAHADFAADPELAKQAHTAIDGGAGAEQAVGEAFDGFRDMLAASGDEYLAARATDLTDVRDQVIDVLTGAGPKHVPAQRSVVVALDLAPSDTARLPRKFLAGIACEQGSPTSHAAILSRSLGIPAVVGVTGLMTSLGGHTTLAIDGSSGEVLVDPPRADRERFETRAADEVQRRASLEALRDELGRTADGRHVELAVNVNEPEALTQARDAGAEGSGLVRTEFLFLDRQTAPDVETQTRHYRDVLAAFPGQRVVVRTMDIGADKPLPFIRRDPEENPALGVRGLRLSLAVPELLRDQLRALVRASAGADSESSGRLAIMFPMVSRIEEFNEARHALDEIAAEEGIDASGIEVGLMIEVPAAALAARSFARRADFVSIGTNDLLQYLFAADRLLADVAGLPDILQPSVLRLLDRVFTEVHAENAWVGVCGEAAADPVSAAALVGLGVDELSMTPNAIPEIKDLLRQVTYTELREAVESAMGSPDARMARRLITSVLPGY
jgi:phosphoenolpyruvate-protein phosphotransferase